MFNKLSVGARLGLLVALLCAIMLAIGLAGLRGMGFSNDKLKTVYEDRTVTLVQLGKVLEAGFRMGNALEQVTGAVPGRAACTKGQETSV